MNTAYSIDWLSVTFKGQATDLDLRKALSFGFPLKTWGRDKGKFGYQQAFIHPFGIMVMSNHARPEMGVHVSFSGRALRSLAEQGQASIDLLKWAINQGGRISRIDLAIDVFDVEINPIELAKCARVKDVPGTARKWSYVKGHDGGTTAYLGSRKSERFLRIYDKAAEQGRSDILWTRFELELKSDSARAAGAHFALLGENERGGYIKGLIKNLFNPDDEVFQTAMEGNAEPLKTAKDTDDKTLDWVMGTVASSVAKLMARRADVDIWGGFVQQVHANLVSMGHLGLSDE